MGPPCWTSNGPTPTALPFLLGYIQCIYIYICKDMDTVCIHILTYTRLYGVFFAMGSLGPPCPKSPHPQARRRDTTTNTPRWLPGLCGFGGWGLKSFKFEGLQPSRCTPKASWRVFADSRGGLGQVPQNDDFTKDILQNRGACVKELLQAIASQV